MAPDAAHVPGVVQVPQPVLMPVQTSAADHVPVAHGWEVWLFHGRGEVQPDAAVVELGHLRRPGDRAVEPDQLGLGRRQRLLDSDREERLPTVEDEDRENAHGGLPCHRSRRAAQLASAGGGAGVRNEAFGRGRRSLGPSSGSTSSSWMRDSVDRRKMMPWAGEIVNVLAPKPFAPQSISSGSGGRYGVLPTLGYVTTTAASAPEIVFARR